MRWIASMCAMGLLSGCLQAGPGGCSTEEAAAFNEIDHFGAEQLTPEDHPYGICGATLTSAADPDVVIGHYENVLPQAGWTVGEVESAPMVGEDEEPIGRSINLAATKGDMTFSIGAELFDSPGGEGGEEPTYSILVGNNAN